MRWLWIRRYALRMRRISGQPFGWCMSVARRLQPASIGRCPVACADGDWRD